jgi:uncharacterized metal-binding protein YceD (DUF177 family)
MPPPLPFSRALDLAGMREKDATVRLLPDAQQRAAIAEWLGLRALENFTAEITITRRTDAFYRYDAEFAADVVQACVVTLEPVPAHIEGAFARDFRLTAQAGGRKRKEREAGALEVVPASHAVTGEDAPEPLDGTILDVAAPVLEELSLALDPYPKAPGAAFESAEEAEEPVPNPFAALEKLKNRKG